MPVIWNGIIVLNNGDRDNQNAYHEFFAVMQTGQDIPFEIKEIVVEGHVRKPTPVLSLLGVESKKTMRATAAGITLRSPYSPEQLVDEDNETDDTTPESETFEENPFPEESNEEPETPPAHDGSEEIPNDDSDAAPSPFGTEDVNDDESDDDVASDDAGGCSAHHTQSSTMSALIMALFSLLVYRRLRSRWFSPTLSV